MRQRSNVPRPESRLRRLRRRFAFRAQTLRAASGPRHSLPLILMFTLALTGCDLFDPAKTDDPVFGPPPPRKLAAKTATTTPPATQTAESAPASSDSATVAPVDTGGAQQAAGTTRGTAPADGMIKRVSFTRQLPPPSKKLAGTEVAAMVNGQPIFCSEIFERANPEPLTAEGMSLLAAIKNPKQVTDREVRQMQEMAIRKYLKDYVKTRVLCQALEFKLEKEQKDKIEEAIKKMFDEYVEKLKKDLKVLTKAEVDSKLKESGTVAGESPGRIPLSTAGRRIPATEIEETARRRPSGNPGVLQSASGRLQLSRAQSTGSSWKSILPSTADRRRRWRSWKRSSTRCVAAKTSARSPRNTPTARADAGGQQSWTKPDSVADAKTAAWLHKVGPAKSAR